MNENIWQRFRARVMEGNDQVQYLRDWATLRDLTASPQDALERLKATVAIDAMTDAAYEHFRKAMVLVNAAYAHRAGLPGISDPEQWQKRFIAYISGSDPEARQYDTFLTLRGNIDSIRKLPQQEPPYSAAELKMAQDSTAIFGELALLLNRAGPGSASQEVLDGLKALIDRYQNLLSQSESTNRARRQVLDAMAEAQYAAGRTSMILRRYDEARDWFQAALASFEKLGDQFGIQVSRQQLSALHIVSSGDVDAAVRSNLATLTRQPAPGGSLERATALVSQINQTMNAGDRFAATRLIREAVEELERQRYLSDERFATLEAALLAWIESVPANLHGTDFVYQLTQVIQLYAGIWGARASMFISGAKERLEAISKVIQQASRETLKADEEIQRQFAVAGPRPLAPPAAARA